MYYFYKFGFVISVVVIIFLFRQYGKGSAGTSNAEKSNKKTFTPDMARASNFLRVFKQAQNLLLSSSIKNNGMLEKEKIVYLHFMLGACARTALTIENKDDAEVWWLGTSIAEAAIFYSPDDAWLRLERYGCSGDPQLQKAGERGWNAMDVAILSVSDGRISDAEYRISCLELFKVVDEVR